MQNLVTTFQRYCQPVLILNNGYLVQGVVAKVKDTVASV